MAMDVEGKVALKILMSSEKAIRTANEGHVKLLMSSEKAIRTANEGHVKLLMSSEKAIRTANEGHVGATLILVSSGLNNANSD